MDKKIFTVVVAFQVESDSLDTAEDYIAGQLNRLVFRATEKGKVMEAEVQTDYETDNSNQRVYYFHPSDVDADYDADEYQRKLDEELVDDRVL